MEPRWFALTAGTLAVWRLTHLLNAEDGPFDVFAKLRLHAGNGFFGRMLDCFYCLSLWVSAPMAALLWDAWLDRVILWLAMSGGAILLERVTVRGAPPASYHED